MPKVGICTPTLTEGDAVSNDVLGMKDAFLRRGYEVYIFAGESSVKDLPVYGLDKVKLFLKKREDIFIYHYSVGWDVGISFFKSLGCMKVVKYHNVTPPEFFIGVADNYVIACSSGRDQLKELLTISVDLYLGDSYFNLNELACVGINLKHSAVVHPFHHVDRLKEVKKDDEIFGRYRDNKVNLISVGRVVPNKAQHELIEMFAIYHNYYNSNSRLIIVGKEDPSLNSYNKRLRFLARRLGIEGNVIFTGMVPDEALRSYYELADIFVILSKHEGFCVPLIEAMAMRIPIVCYASTAVTETVDGCGIVWEERDSELIAASLDRIIEDKRVYSYLKGLGFQRYQDHFTNEKVESSLFDAFSKAGLI